MTTIAAAGPPVKAGPQPENRIAGTLAMQIQRINQPRPTPPVVTPTARRFAALEIRVAELERLVLMLLEQREAKL